MIIRILFVQPVPSVIVDWTKARSYSDKVWRGANGTNFQVVDIEMSEEDGVLFKLTFPLVVFSREEMELSDATGTTENAADKSRLYDRKFDEYMKLYTDEEQAW